MVPVPRGGHLPFLGSLGLPPLRLTGGFCHADWTVWSKSVCTHAGSGPSGVHRRLFWTCLGDPISLAIVGSSDPEVLVDQVSDLSSTKKPTLFLGFPFLQIDLFLQAGILDDSVQCWSNSRIKYFKVWSLSSSDRMLLGQGLCEGLDISLHEVVVLGLITCAGVGIVRRLHLLVGRAHRAGTD